MDCIPCNHLRDVDVAALGTTQRHDQWCVRVWEIRETKVSGFLPNLREFQVELSCERDEIKNKQKKKRETLASSVSSKS